MKWLDFWRPSPRVALFLALGVLVIGGLNAFSATVDYLQNGGQIWWRPLVMEYSSVGVIGLLVTPVFRLVELLPFTRTNWPLRLSQHFGFGLIFSLLHVMLMVGVRKAVFWLAGSYYEFGHDLLEFVYELSKDLLTYQSLMVGSYAFLFWRGLQEQKMHSVALEAEMADLRLRRIRDQLRPHFLFNTLNMISSCMYEDVEKADKLLADLCTLLRYSLDKADVSTLSLSDELHFVALYLSLASERFSGRVTWTCRIDPATTRARVPRFLLQPLVENAIEHGFGERQGTGRIEIVSELRDARLVVCVCDDGAGWKVTPEAALHQGLGLSNTQSALAELYPDQYRLVLRNGDHGGAVVEIEIPFEEVVDARLDRG